MDRGWLTWTSLTRLLHRPRRCAGSVGAGRVRPPRVEIATSIPTGPATARARYTRWVDVRRTRPAGRGRSLMRGWGDLPGDDPETDRAETRAAIEAAGIDLDPVPPGVHRHGDETHPSDHAHPHVHAEPGRAADHRHRRGRRGRHRARRRPDPRAAGRSTRSPAVTRAGASGSARWSRCTASSPTRSRSSTRSS